MNKTMLAAGLAAWGLAALAGEKIDLNGLWDFRFHEGKQLESEDYRRAGTKGLRNRSYGVNTGGLVDLYRRPKMSVEAVRQCFKTKGND